MSIFMWVYVGVGPGHLYWIKITTYQHTIPKKKNGPP